MSASNTRSTRKAAAVGKPGASSGKSDPKPSRTSSGYMPKSVGAAPKTKEESRICFYGDQSPFSNMYIARFQYDDEMYNCVEQWMQAAKAAYFKDKRVHNKILNEDDPKVQKSLGRKVKPFDAEEWSNEAYAVVLKGVYLKFKISDKTEILCKELLATGESEIVEASKSDTVWGVGMSVKDARNHTGDWPGQNLLGKALMEVRAQLKKGVANEENVDADSLDDDTEKELSTGKKKKATKGGINGKDTIETEQ